MSFSGNVVIITGGSRGIGAGTACHLSKLGANVAIVDINTKRLSDVSDEIVKSGCPRPLSIVADVTKDQQRIIDETINHFGRLHVLVLLILPEISPWTVTDFNSDEFDRIINVNLKSVMALMHLAVPHLEKTTGNIVNVSSDAAIKAAEFVTTYCISKAGLDMLTKCAAKTLAPKAIRVNAVNSGFIETNMFTKFLSENYDQGIEELKQKILVGRVGHVSDISSAIVYLASESFVNGTSIAVDGGYLLS